MVRSYLVAADQDRQVKAVRAAFLESAPVPPGVVSDRVLKSWRRSMASGVNPDTVEPAFDGEVDTDSELCRLARPVLADLADSLTDTATAVFLSDTHARLLTCWVPDTVLRRKMDDVRSEPGYRFDEESTGTNAVGTALEEGRATAIVGAEHFSELMHDAACVAVPIHHPATRRIVGVVDLTCLLGNANGMLLPVARRCARDIEEQLFGAARTNDQLLLAKFRARAAATGRAVLVAGPDTLIANSAAASALNGVNTDELWASVQDVATTGQERRVQLANIANPRHGTNAKFMPIVKGGDVCGVVTELSPRADRNLVEPPSLAAAARTVLDELVGSSVATTELRDRIAGLAQSSTPVAFIGEAGSGRQHAAHTLMTLRFPDLTPEVVTAADLAPEVARVAAAASPLIVTGVDKLGVAAVTDLIDVLPDDLVAAGKIALTAEASSRTDPGGLAVSAVSAVRVELLPLRFRRNDIMPLAAHFADLLIAQHGRSHSRIRFAPDVVQLLCRYDWPGNCLELRGVVGASLATALWSDVTMKDVPTDIVRNAGKHRRTLIEEAEADVIRSTLELTHWNKAKAAELLEISRSRLYRKVKAYGLVPNLFPHRPRYTMRSSAPPEQSIEVGGEHGRVHPIRQCRDLPSRPRNRRRKERSFPEDVASHQQAITAMLAAIDAGDLAAAMNYLRDDVRVLFGNLEALVGTGMFAQLFQQLTSSLHAVRHEIHDIWPAANDLDVLIATMTAHYTRTDGRRVSLPCCNVFRMSGVLIAEYRVYMDISPALTGQ
jgi:transcriptional regulator of acetoin/glycerol metabolism/ketosteroid isomerase-like protein